MTTQMAVDKPSASKLDVAEYLTSALSLTPADLHPFFIAFQDLHSRKLWHQLTLKLAEFFDHPLSRPYRVDVFDRFVRDFETKLNQLRLVEMGVKVSKDIDNPAANLTFLRSLLERIPTDKAPDAHVLLLSSLANAKLLFGDAEGAKTDMDAALVVLDGLATVENRVRAAYYKLAADYYKAKAEYEPFYRNSLLFLACIDLAELDPEARLVCAHDLSVAAFLGESIYNFGELLMHPILNVLDDSPHAWLKRLLFTFNEGNIGKFEALAPYLEREPILHSNLNFMRQKICLMALIESVFKRAAYDRTLSYQTISQETQLPIDQVEHLVMKGLSLGLIKGHLDGVDEKVTLTWVQPRVLSPEQVSTLAKRLKVWGEKLHKVEDRIAPEVTATA